MKVVLIGPDPKIQEKTARSLKLGWPDATVQGADTAPEGLRLVKQVCPDVVLFTGTPLPETIRALRDFYTIPMSVLVLAYQHEDDYEEVAIALQAGADDYIRLPCDPNLITARVAALLRRKTLPLVLGKLTRKRKHRG